MKSFGVHDYTGFRNGMQQPQTGHNSWDQTADSMNINYGHPPILAAGPPTGMPPGKTTHNCNSFHFNSSTPQELQRHFLTSKQYLALLFFDSMEEEKLPFLSTNFWNLLDSFGIF